MRRAAVIVALCCGWWNASAAWAQPAGPHDPIARATAAIRHATAVLAGTASAGSATRTLGTAALSRSVLAAASGRARSVSVDVAPGATATTLVVTISADAGHRIGHALRTVRISLRGRTGWVSAGIGSLAITRGHRYWITVRTTRGRLRLRTGAARLSAFVSGASAGGARASAASASSPSLTQTGTGADGKVPPTLERKPTVSGSAQQGQMLSSTPGIWTVHATYTYQWRDCSAGCKLIAGATHSTYTLAPSDVGEQVDVVVTARNTAGSANATSAPTAAVIPIVSAPVNTAPPTISGFAQTGQTLTAGTGTWSNVPLSYAYQWQDCRGSTCTDIAGATASTYTATASDLGATIDVVVTATNLGGSTSASSMQTATVLPLPPADTTPPTISGTAQQGQTLTAATGTWSNTPTSYAYQWQDCASSCTDISGATASTYTLGAGDVGDTIDVVVSATNTAGSASATSAPTAAVTGVTTASGIHVSGNQLLDGSGSVVRLRGVVRSGTEYMCSEGYGIFDGPNGSSEFQPMVSWGIDTVFIGLNEDCWLGINGISSAYAGTNYINAIKSEVTAAESAGLYPVLGWFWGDPGTEVPTGNDPNGGGQPALPDNDHAPLFWQQLAQTFKNDPNVIFRLQEEPHPSATGPNGAGASTSGGFATNLAQWQCWAQGSVQYTPSSDSTAWGTAPTPTATTNNCEEYATGGSTLYRTVGMQSLINIIRGAGADNVIQVPGIGYANMLACSPTQSPSSCGFLDSADGVALHDTLSTPQLMADVDVYPDAGQVCSSTSCYDTTYGPVAAQMPLDAGEVGPNGSTDTNTNAFLDWMDSQGANYYAWVWDTWGSLISNYNGTPDSPWGTAYQQRLTGQSAPAPVQPTDGITLNSQATGCTNPTSTTITLTHAVSAGDDLFLVTGGGGYTGTASTVTGVSDNVNGTWTRMVNTGSQLGGNQEYVSYAVYELRGSKAAAANSLTITLSGAWGQSGMSTVVTDASGVASLGPSTFDSTVGAQTSTWTSNPLTPLASGDVVLGLFANYSHASDSTTAPSGWNTDATKTVNTSNCAGASVDWAQTTGTSPLSATIDDNSSEYHYSGAIDLHP